MKNSSIRRPAPVTREKQRGFSLTELAIVIGIIGLILAGIWTAAQSVNESNTVDQAAQEFQAVSQNMLTLYEGRAWPPAAGCAGTPDITSTAISASIIPSQYVITGACSSAIQPWSGGTFAISANNPNAPPGLNTFRLSFYNVPDDGCIKLLMQGTSCDPTQPGCPVQVQTDKGAVAPSNPLFVGSPPPANGWQGKLNPAIATALCELNAAPGAGPNSVEFDFKL